MRKDVTAGEWIANSHLLLVSDDRTERAVTLRIGRPYDTGEGDWACPVETEGLHGRGPDIHGVGSFQSLCLASLLLRRLLEDFVAKGGKLLDPRDRTEVALSAFFGGNE